MKKGCGDEKVDILVVGESIEANLNENKIIVKGIKDGTSQIKVNVNGIEYKDIKVMVGWIAIYTEEDLINIKNGLNKNYIIMKDISLTKEWVAIGDNTNPFNGVLEGNYHKISGLNNGKTNSNNQGMFGESYGKITNLSIDGNLTGTSCVGVLVGINRGVVENVHVSGTVKCTNQLAGGIVGYNIGGTIKKSYSNVEVEGKSYIGGLVGNCINGVTIENCYSLGSVKGYSMVGGLCAMLDVGMVTNSYSLSNISYNYDGGGLIGAVGNGATIQNSYWCKEIAGVETSAGGRELTKEEMKKQSSYEGFDFTSESPTWVMKIYPELNYNFGGK